MYTRAALAVAWTEVVEGRKINAVQMLPQAPPAAAASAPAAATRVLAVVLPTLTARVAAVAAAVVDTRAGQAMAQPILEVQQQLAVARSCVLKTTYRKNSSPKNDDLCRLSPSQRNPTRRRLWRLTTSSSAEWRPAKLRWSARTDTDTTLKMSDYDTWGELLLKPSDPPSPCSG